ncbi:regulator of G-protein signaling 3-like [Boleophthalmus pectinirostris]|uniref:regulator of G-protein signaling 3-like n=1 Tax=Boleophthalmus pectinirostris TaxID=150288 RepID=UPI002431AFB5|nr:regulator of G-protein signaling 3-like [Boleophthalmus pectinirostris]
MFWRNVLWPFDGTLKDTDDDGFLLTAEHAVPFCINPTVSSEPGSQVEPSLVSNDGRSAPKEQANTCNTSTRVNANVSSSSNPGRTDSSQLKMVIARGPDGFGFTIFSDCPVRVQDVDSGGPAHSAGLRHGDAVLQLNGVSVETWGCGQLAHAIRCCPAHISLVIWRPAAETTPTPWPRPPLQQSEVTKSLEQSGAENRRRGQRSLWRRSQDKGVEPNPTVREEPALRRPVLSGFGGEDYILLSSMEQNLSAGRATTIGRWYHPPPSTRPSYSSATLPPLLAKTLGCYGDYENCTIVQSHLCDDFGSIAPKTLIFPIHLKPIDLCSPNRTLLMSEDLILHQPDLLPAKVTVMVYTDLLLFTKEDEIGRYNILQSPVYLDTVSFIEVSSKPLHLFFLRTAHGSVQFSLEAYSLQQKHRLSICLHDNMHHLVSMETQRLSLHDNSPTSPECKQTRDQPSELLAPPPAPVSALCSPVWKPRSTEYHEPGQERTPDAVEPVPVYSEPEDTYEKQLRRGSDSPSGLTRSLSEGSLLHEPRSPHLLSHSPVLTWPLRASLGPESSGVPQPSVLTLKKHLTEGGSLHRALELLYGTKALEAGPGPLKKRNKNLVSLAFLQRRKNSSFFSSNSLEKALRNNRPATEQVQRWAESLEALLTNQYGLAVFRHFLRSEFSEENLDFWLAVEKFKRTCPQKMVSKATRIYNEFISCNATRQVNIDSTVRELTNQRLSLRLSPSSFQLAQDQIYNLMLTDSYPRFLKSRLYTQLANQNLRQSQKLL